MALCAGGLKAPLTALQHLLEEINFQRTKEMRQLLKDDGGFVMLQGTTYWTDLFVRHFLFQSEPEHSIDSDDLLFFVRKKHVKGSSRHMPKFETEVDVFRKDSRKLPIGDPDVDWEETVYLNLVIHQFDYTLTLAICTRTSPKELQVLRRHSQRVYASPSRRKMDTKGDSEEITYPHICFMVDNFDEVFSDILVRDGEMVCVELVASDRDGSVQGVIFLGSIRYDALKKVYDARQSSLSTKVAQRMTFGLFSSGGPQTRCEFVRMKGPQGKGHAEMAVTKPKGSGVETPTSEPGYSAADMWDSEWDEDPDDFYNYRHQRRLSDPSASLNNFSRYAFRTKSTHDSSAGARARSENEGLDTLASEVSEIEAGDLRDDRPASSASETKLSTAATITSPSTTTTSCCNCFLPKKRWSDSASGQMSDIYCRTCDEANSPACLTNITPKKIKSIKHRNILTVESEIEMPNTIKSKSPKKEKKNSLATSVITTTSSNDLIKSNLEKKDKQKNGCNNNTRPDEEYELADDATSLNNDKTDDLINKFGILNDLDQKLMIRVHGKEELPVEQTTTTTTTSSKQTTPIIKQLDNNKKIISNKNRTYPSNSNNDKQLNRPNKMELFERILKGNNKKLITNDNHQNHDDNNDDDDDDFIKINNTKSTFLFVDKNKIKKNSIDDNNEILNIDDYNGNFGNNIRITRSYSTLPKRKRNINHHSMWYHNRPTLKVPNRTTPDGTRIYYWCDLPKRVIKELDDGAYNPLWATRGFTQTFHFWKEHRRQQSTPLNAFLTYVTLPWWSIAKDLLDHRETPILTF